MHPTIEVLYLYAKVVAATGSAAGVIYGIIKWLRATYYVVKSTNENVSLLMSNHLPHLQSSLNEHTESLNTLSSDVRDVGTKVDGMEARLEDTKLGVKVLGESFLRHLESASREAAPRNRKRNAIRK